MRLHRILAGLAATALAAGLPLASATPAVAATPQAALADTGGYGGYSTGSAIHAQALSQLPTALANISLAQSAAGATVGEELVTQDLLESAVLFADPAGKNAYGHGSAANVGLGQDQSAVPQIAPSTAEALSPPPAEEVTTELLSLPAEIAQLASAQLLPSAAFANTTSVDSICPSPGAEAISGGRSEVANVQLLSPEEGQHVVEVGGTEATEGVVDAESFMRLEAPSGGASGQGLSAVTTESLATVTLFAGIPDAETDIAVLRDLQLRATATGADGSELFYGFVDAEGNPVPDSEEVLRINDTVLTSEQVLGGDGIQLSLGVADVFIGAPAHGLDDDPTSDPTVSSTAVAGAADFIRIKVPGTVPTGSTKPVADDSPLAPVLNPVLEPVIEGLKPVLEQIQAGLRDAGLEVADVRVGHLEALSTVPAGGIDCDDDPLQSEKDVSTLSATPGSTFDYVVRFQNMGDEDMTDVRVVDTYSAELEFVESEGAVTPDGGEAREVAQPSQDGNTLTYEIGTVEPRAVVNLVITFRVPDDAADGTLYRNDAVISVTYKGEPIEDTVEEEGPTVIADLPGGCNVSRSTKYASHLEVMTGQQFTYFVNVNNSGGEDCTGVAVTDELIDGVEFVSCSDECTVDGRTVTFELGTLTSGSTRTVAIVVKTTATEGTLPNDADIDTDQGETANPSTPGPTVTDVSVLADGNPAGCPATGCDLPATLGSGDRKLAATGLVPLLPALGLLVVVGALAVRRRF